MKKWNDDDVKMDFLEMGQEGIDTKKDIDSCALKPIKIMIADDDEEVHTVTKMMLGHFCFEGHPIEFVDTYTGLETKYYFKNNDDIAIIFLDVVMEQSHSGLDVVSYIRNELGNSLTRIILRTGQPGEAPEEHVIRDYDINDYRLKTEMTMQRLTTTLYAALRNYRDLKKLDRNRKGLEKIIKASANLFKHNTMDDFFTGILDQLSTFYAEDAEVLYIRKDGKLGTSGFVTIEEKEEPIIVAASGKYQRYIGSNLAMIAELQAIYDWMAQNDDVDQAIQYIGGGFIIKKTGKNQLNNYIFIEGSKDLYDIELINLFMTNYSIALDNYILNSMISNTQKEIIITLGEVAEKHFDDTGGHIRRISDMMYAFARVNHFSFAESEMIKVASTMHDVGKIAIPDQILKKPAKLTADEYEVVKEHASIGYEILSKSKLDILKLASEIALNHHEKFDGTGYPTGLKGKDIPLSARMMAIVDVFDAMTHKRCYKDAIPVDETLDYIRSLRGTHFDPDLVDLFIGEYTKIARLSHF